MSIIFSEKEQPMVAALPAEDPLMKYVVMQDAHYDAYKEVIQHDPAALSS